jgi:hypothetical protein
MDTTDLALQGIADKLLAPYFDGMPSVPIVVGKEESFREKAMAHYLFSVRKIEVHPFWASDRTSFGSIQTSVKHELIHAWIHWKGLKGKALKDEEVDCHNEYFLWKAHQMKIDIRSTLERYPALKPDYEIIKLGWNPFDNLQSTTPVNTPLEPVNGNGSAYRPRLFPTSEDLVVQDEENKDRATNLILLVVGFYGLALCLLWWQGNSSRDVVLVALVGVATLVAVLVWTRNVWR